MKDMILHMGFHKTGSSALQVWLAQHRKQLLEHNILYPEGSGDKAADGKISSGNSDQLAYFLRKPWWKPKSLAFKKQLIAQLNTFSNGGMLLYSNENLSLMQPKQFLLINDLCHNHDTKFKAIFYVRSITGYAISWYNQQVKNHGYFQSFDHFIRHDLSINFELVFGLLQHEIHVDLYNYNKIKHGIEQHFSHNVLQLPLEEQATKTQRVNRSLDEDELAFMRQLNMDEALRPFCQKISEQLIYQYPNKHTKKNISHQDQQFLEEKFGPLVQRLNETFPQLELSVSDAKVEII